MIIDKKVFDEHMQCVQDIASKYDFIHAKESANASLTTATTGTGNTNITNTIAINGGNKESDEDIGEQLASFKAEVKDHAFRVLMLGIFSSGKTALLNRLLNQPLLTESQAPETTIATEIRYDIRNYIEAVGLDNSVKEYSFDQVDSIPVASCRNLVYHIDNPFLHDHSDLILVDMPGIDSSFEAHNKAIANYLVKGSAYLLLVTAKEGSLRQSLVDFLKEVNHYPQSLACFVSMQDLIMPSEVASVVNKIQSGINAIFKEQIQVQPISSRKDSDEEFYAKVENALQTFNPQQLFEAKFSGKLQNIAAIVYSMLQSYRNSLVLDLTEIEDQIKQCIHAKKVLAAKQQQQERELEANTQEMMQNISGDVERALNANVDNLTTAALAGESALQNALSSIIRPVLIESAQRYNEANYKSLIEQLDFSSISNSIQSALENEQTSQKLQEIIGSFIKSVTDKLGNKEDSSNLLTARNANTLSLVASAAAITTSFINPIIELIIVFLPQIILSIFGKDKETLEQEKREKVKEALRSQVFPEVIAKLQPNLSEAIRQQNTEMLEQVHDYFKQLVSAQEVALEKAFQSKTERTDSHEQKLAEIDADLHKLHDCIVQINARS